MSNDWKRQELIERLEQADAGTRKLDRGVARLLGWYRVRGPRFTKSKYGGWISPGDFCGTMSDGSPIYDGLHGTTIHRDPPRFTSSVDAALAQLPEGWWWSLNSPNGFAPYETYSATICEPNKVHDRSFDGEAATPALAICIARLRATAVEEGK